jgi:anti-anti-sigma factor
MDSSALSTPGGEPRMTVTLTLGEPSVIVVAGDMDLDDIGTLRDAVDRALRHHPQLIFDLAGVTFADSTFLNTLLIARESALEQAGSVSLLAPSTVVHHLLAITGAAALFSVVTAEQLRQP